MKRLLVVALLLMFLVILVAGCGGGDEATIDGGEATSTDGGPIGQAESTACAANRRAITSAMQQYRTMEGANPTSIQQLIPGYIQSIPTCPSGGTYSISGGTVVCSVHGS